jgi:2-polyprenyl-3-methyl-5-hydroxy-6-metoxy-1,4-benzoquinol methylase
MLDVGCRDFFVSRQFAEAGYRVHGIDPKPVEPVEPPDGVTFQQTTLEAFETRQKYDLVVASLVSQFVDLSLPDFMTRLSNLCELDGLIYLTLIGDQDTWAPNPKVKAVSVEIADRLVVKASLRPIYHSIQWFEGSTYDGNSKFWHVYEYLLVKTEDN